MDGTPRVGIDLGTTFSCVAALDARGRPVVVPNELGDPTTPSALWFDGHEAWVGRCAYDREREEPGFLLDFVKRDTGKPPEIPPHLFDRPDAPPTAPYNLGGFSWGVVGVQGVFLRKLRRDAVRRFQREGRLPPGADPDDVRLDAVVTVPAYFKDLAREQTRQAAEVAGLRLLPEGIVNEPTAAALTYRLVRSGAKTVFVFDLGGGTFDVTFLRLRADGHAEVLASDGNDRLGGRNWDDLVFQSLRDAFVLKCRCGPAPAAEFPLRQQAVAAKVRLSAEEAVEVALDCPDGSRPVVPLHRRRPPGANPYETGAFYFETRASSLLTQIRAVCERARRAVRFEPVPGQARELGWDDVDEVVMVGGASRMPMVADLLETLTGKRVRTRPDGFDLDTAVASGAALYALNSASVTDVSSGTYGLKLRRREGDFTYDFVEPLIRKNTPLPADVEREFLAGADAVFELYQGESEVPEECVLRGRLDLHNPEGPVTVELHMDRDGRLTAAVSFPAPHGGPPVRHTLEIESDLFEGGAAEATWLSEVRRRVRAVTIHDCPPPG